jgi:RimJ/RimL family protein N-acetyltransferase
LGTEYFFEETNAKSVIAIIKQENIKLIKAFTKAGYTEISKEIIKGVDRIRMVKERG